MIFNLFSSIKRSLPQFPRAYWYLWIGNLLNRLGTFIVPFLSFYLTSQRGLFVNQVVLTVSLFGVGSFSASFIGGILADLLGRRTTMSIGLFTSVAVMLSLIFIHTFVLLAIFIVFLGFFSELYRPAISTVIVDIVPSHDRVQAYGLMYWASNIGAAIAPLIAGLIASHTYTLLFLLDALTTLSFCILVYRHIPETKPIRVVQETGTSISYKEKAFFREPLLLIVSVLMFLFASIFYQAYSTLPLDMRAHGLKETQYGIVIAMNGAVIVLLGIPASRILARLPRFSILATASLLMGTGFGLLLLARTTPFYALTVAVWTLGELAITPIVGTVVADLSPTHLRGFYQGMLRASWGLASCVGPAAGGLIFTHLGAHILWQGCFVLGLIVAISYTLLSRPVHRRLRMRSSVVDTNQLLTS